MTFDLNDSMDLILQKQQKYDEQIAPIRDIVFPFGVAKGWIPIRRGRHAHASICGPVHEFHGIIDIQMELVPWEAMPLSLTDDYPFTLWASANKEVQGRKLYSQIELFWRMPFSDLERYVRRFMDRAWRMLSDLSPDDFADSWPGPSTNPDTKPHFGEPRMIKRLPPQGASFGEA